MTPDRWKQKFLDSLEHCEQTEKELASLENLLRLAISRLTLAANGIDPVLDGQLQKVRDSVRQATDARVLEPLLEDLTGTLNRMDDETSRGALHRLSASQVLEQLLDGLALPRALRRSARALAKQLKNQNSAEHLADHLAGLRDLLTQALDPATPGAGKTAPDPAGGLVEGLRRFLDRVLGQFGDSAAIDKLRDQLDQAESADQLPTFDPAQVGAALLASPNRVVAQDYDGTGTPADASPPAAVHDAESRMLEFMHLLPSQLQTSAEPIRRQLVAGLDASQWSDLLTQLAEMVTQTREEISSDREDLKGFLQQLTGRLQDIDLSLRGTEQHHLAAFASGTQLAQGVHDDLDDLKLRADDAIDLPSIKQVIEQRTEKIFDRLQRFRDGEAERHSQWSAEMDQLKARLGELESQTESLNQDLQAEQRKASHDALTGLINRMAYDERLAQEASRWELEAVPLSLVVCDIDRFKRLNDKLGHQAGDKVLKSVAAVIKKSVRKTDIVARYGGEEFVALLPNSDATTASQVAEQIRSNVAAANFRFQGKQVTVTLSCGYSQFAAGDAANEVFERADRYLYCAKDGGRNCVVGDPLQN